jgi:hypothetical protein
MHDLPSQTLLQQAHAQPVSGEELEVMGKKAASRYLCGGCRTLNDAVVETVKQAGLSPEQVKRVIEFANTNAYIERFNKLGSDHKYVEFDGGPADPSVILKDLNDGGGGTVFDRGMADYNQMPLEKSSSVLLAQNRERLGLEKVAAGPSMADLNPAETAFEQMWQSEDRPLPYAEPFQDIIEMREKLADSRDQLRSELNALEVDYLDVGERLYHLVKQAALEGTPIGHVIQAWGEVVPGPSFVKVAFGTIGPRLVEEQVLNYNELGASMTKTAGARAVVDTSHPLVECFSRFCDTLTKLAATRDVYHEVSDLHGKAEYFLTRGLVKVAADDVVGEAAGLIPKAWRAAKGISASVADPASRVMGSGVGLLFGPSAGAAAGKLTGGVIRRAPEIATALAAKEVYDHLRYTPAFQATKNLILSRVPYTQQHMIRQYDLQNQMMGMP